jgi:hypothetical protein
MPSGLIQKCGIILARFKRLILTSTTTTTHNINVAQPQTTR